MVKDKTPLEQKLIARIAERGPLTFRDFMQSALYDEELGYYNTARAKIGAGGDYYTSSNVHPAFGAILARAFAEMWNRDETESLPQPLTIIEAGAGTGRLAFDLLTAMSEEHRAAFDELRYVIIETSPAMKRLQQEMLAGFGSRVMWSTLQELQSRPVKAIMFSNELIDALPVHCARWTPGGLEELFVTAKGDCDTRLAPLWGAPSTARLTSYLERMQVRLIEGQIIEINLDALAWLEQASRALDSGYLVTIDYGDLAAHLYGPDRLRGTLRSFYRHRLIDSPFARAGEQDITASVNFTALMEYGKDCGFDTVSFERQAAFLIRMGLIDRIAATQKGEAEGLSDMKERLALKNLFAPGGVSDNFRVLVQRKRAAPATDA